MAGAEMLFGNIALPTEGLRYEDTYICAIAGKRAMSQESRRDAQSLCVTIRQVLNFNLNFEVVVQVVTVGMITLDLEF